MEENTSRFEGKSIVTTCLTDEQEKEVTRFAEMCGGAVKSAVSGKTDYLVVSDTNLRETTKYTRAKELIREGKAIQMVGYAEFVRLAKENVARLGDQRPKAGQDRAQRAGGRQSTPDQFAVQAGLLKEYNGSADIVVIPDGVKAIGSAVFAMKKLREVVIPEGVTEIRKDAFKNCRQLQAVTLPASLKTISSFVFADCRSLESIVLPDSLLELGEGAFMDCISLKSIRIPDGVAIIHKHTFRNCGASKGGQGSMREVILPARLKRVEDKAFICRIDKLVLNGDDPTFSRNAFHGRIRELIVGEGVKKIPGYTFLECGEILSITFKSKETTVGSSAFDDRSDPVLAAAVLPAQVPPAVRRWVSLYAAELIVNGKEPSAEYRELWIKSIKGQKATLEEDIDDKDLRDLMLREGLVSVKRARELMEETTDNELKLQLMEYIGRMGPETADTADGLDLDSVPTLAEVRKNFKLTLNGAAAAVTGYKGTDTEVVVPPMAGKYRITAIGTQAFKGENITAITLPETVDSIGWEAFKGCISLARVALPSGLKSIEGYAFSDCSNLTSLTLPNRLKSIGWGAFSGCSNLADITLPNGLKSIGKEAFSGCSSLAGLSFPKSLKTIAEGAFLNCSDLQSIAFAASLTDLGVKAFKGCIKLADHQGLVIVEGTLFDYCGSGGTVVVPDGVTMIGREAFFRFRDLKNIILPEGVTTIGDSAFYECPSLTEVNLPSSIKVVGEHAFNGCRNLTKLTLLSKPVIGNCAFRRCTGLADIQGLVTVGGTLFDYCGPGGSISIPESVTSIGNYAFARCLDLTCISIPESVKSIGKEAFSGCSNLTKATIPNSVTTIEEYAFQGCSSLTDIMLPKEITVIESGMFSGCSNLTSVTLPEGLTSLDGLVFMKCTSLCSITLPESLRSIGMCAFAHCSQLKTVHMSSNVKKIETGSSSSFLDCPKVTICAPKGSYAERYAKKCGIRFIAE